MPNWCDNALFLMYERDNKKQVRYIEKIIKGLNRKRPVLLNTLTPMPKHDPNPNSPTKFLRKGSLGKYEKELFGDDNWYDWSISNWGTKWEADINDYHTDLNHNNGKLYIYFQSAWSPPIQALLNSRLEELGISYQLLYLETGMNFWGECLDGFDNSHEIVFPENLDFKDEIKIYDYLKEYANDCDIDDTIVDVFDMSSIYLQ